MTDSTTVTFRLPLTALLGVFGLIVCMTPVAFGAPGLQVLYLVPLILAFWVVRTRTRGRAGNAGGVPGVGHSADGLVRPRRFAGR
ncbi:MAG: hypothetical protein ACRDS0_25995 [Pseudonocardiaceae bacterium]